MGLLAKLRPGAFGLVIFGLMLSTVATSVFKGTASTPKSTQASVSKAAVTDADKDPAEASPDTTDEPQDLTYHEYAINTEIENLDRLIRQAARDRLDAGVTAEQVKGSLAAMADQPQTPENTARKLYLLRILRTLDDSEPLPTVEAVEQPTVEGYRDAIGAE